MTGDYATLTNALLVIGIGLLGWVLKKSVDNGEAIAGVRVTTDDIKASSMPREEVETRILEVQKDVLRISGEATDTRVRLSKMEIELARFQG